MRIYWLRECVKELTSKWKKAVENTQASGLCVTNLWKIQSL